MRVLFPILVSVLCAASLHAGEKLDRIVATVDRHPITRSEVEQEAKFTHLINAEKGPITIDDEIAALGRLVDRSLVSNQIAVFGAIPISREDLDTRMSEIRKQIPGAATNLGWVRLLGENGLTQEDVSKRLAQEIETLRFIDLRFRSEVRVGPRAVQTYYDTKFVPEMKAKSLAPPPLDQVQDQIESILREERVNALIADWLKSLRNQSRIQGFDRSLPLTGIDRKTPDVSDLHFLPLHVSGPAEAAKQ